MKKTPNYLEDRICLNVLANSVENAMDCYKAADGHIVLGVLSKNYDSDEAAIADMERYQAATNNALSVGLGAGDPNQSQMVSRISGTLQPQHVNQVFTGVGTSRALLNQSETIVNGLISPTGKVGLVNIATGPLSSQMPAGEVTIETAIALLKDMGGSSIKFFPMKGLQHIEEYKAVAKACAEHDFYLEPTGGIDLENFEEIVQIAIDAGVKKVIPHVYSSIIDATTGDTRPEDVKTLLEMMKKTLA
ncbi:2-dehydro-3-deoxyphosphooctonate aldolase [Carnobacterium divergens]|uniref:2-dehydro-3-deoxy-phosphogluconate aldolase n=1 Tax=Carnobacterium divergens TaxID=2748 RepID=UPI000D4D373B|nr:KDGP aldolase family protein [Carnobacterium divergens]MCO6018693.1 KDGP aldolase family protein [Carnobacterium divergens]TFI63981.1 2-dehydro-3-deoxyphosphooctonate aldolase [Carnobacterium divergens]TFI91144.1 2-dehydro-3-deoxyphosphooctonate aldolase [Carnobacterium divergens]TFJ06011.1 2-dehydro-3-deoxyphosphooctonate aldolase [Carnobacterium divergens]TFJ07659.1 2-dehydro-3-deoxyphosphooctonate aldolase [Carnobacterium divergens]